MALLLKKTALILLLSHNSASGKSATPGSFLSDFPEYDYEATDAALLE